MTIPVSDGKERRGGVFVLSNVAMPEESLPFEISDSIVLRAAGDEEIVALEKALEDTYGVVGSPVAKPTLQYRGEIIVHDAEKRELSDNGCEGKGRFWVIAYPNGWQVEHMVSLRKVGMLTNPQLILGFRYLCNGPNSCGCILSHEMPYWRFSADSFEPHQTVTKEQLELFRNLFRQIHVDQSVPSDLQSCLEDYRSTIRFDWHDHMLTLLYFALIESRITHNPDPKDPTDSLTRQISGKINLLAHRFDQAVAPGDYFDRASLPNKFSDVWKKLYALRSRITHGSYPDFKKDFQCFKSFTNVNSYLNDTIRELIKLCIQEPMLVGDLKEC